MDKRNKFWRRQQMARVFKVRMIFYASCGNRVIHDDGSVDNHPHWFELAKEKWAKVYKTTGVPCSCWMCRGEEYDRKGYKQETLRIIKESVLSKKHTSSVNLVQFLTYNQ